MKKAVIKQLTDSFESHSNHTENGVEFWFARDLQTLLGYTQWRNFLSVMAKAKTACGNSGHAVDDHFADVSKMVSLGSGAKRKVKDVQLTRFACYLIAQNGDPQKEEIAFAQNYFAVQTRKFEIIEEKINQGKRLEAREKLTLSEKQLSKLIFERVEDERTFAYVRSAGDHALFTYNTRQMKEILGVPNNRALADFLQTILIKGKDFATEITNFNIENNNLNTGEEITVEHVRNNTDVRKMLTDRGIFPERLQKGEDTQKLKRRTASTDKKIKKNPNKLK